MAPTTKINLADKVDDGEMDLSMCDLQEVPVKEIAAYRKVWSLDLSNNHLTQLSKAFPTLTNLTKLDLSKNKLKKLPDNFGDLHRLKHLDLYKNELQHLPLSFGQLKSLKWLDLKDNPLVPAIQEAAGDCLDTAQCQVCASNIIYFFTKLREKVDEEREIREKQRQKEKERQNELTAQKSKSNIPEKKKKKEPKQSTSQTKVKCEATTSDVQVSKGEPQAQKPIKQSKRSFFFIFITSLLLILSTLFVLTACGFDMTMFIEDAVATTWSNSISHCPQAVQNVGETFADYFLFVHRKVGYYLAKSENKSYLSILNEKVHEMYSTLIR